MYNNFGLTERKSKIIRLPKFNKEEHIRNYIRGYFDGDGTIAILFKRADYTFELVSGSSGIIKDIQQNIMKYIEVFCPDYAYDNRYFLKTCSGKAQKVLKWLYRDAEIYLDRKYEKFLLGEKVVKKYKELRKNGISVKSAKKEILKFSEK